MLKGIKIRLYPNKKQEIYPGELISIDSNGEGINGSEDDKLMSLEYGLSGDVIKCLIKN